MGIIDRIIKRLEDRVVVFCRTKKDYTWHSCIHNNELWILKGQTLYRLGSPEDVIARFKEELTVTPM